MAGAADTVLAIGQQQQRSLEFLGNSITNGFQQMSLAQKNRADAAEGMFKSALSYKQQQIDSYFKQKNLELQNRRLEIDSQYKQGMLDYHMQSLDQKKDYNSEVLKLRTLDAEQKLAVGSLQKSAATLSAQRLALAASMDANKNVIKELESSLMSGSGNISETELALESAKKRHSQFEEKFNLLGQQAETYGLKIAAASNGVPLSELSSLDLPSSTSSTPQNFVSVFKDDGGYPTLPTSQPSQQLPFLKPSKSIRVPKSIIPDGGYPTLPTSQPSQQLPFLKPSKSIRVPNENIIPPDDIQPVKPVEKPSNQITWDQFQKYYLGADEKDRPGITYKMSQRLDEDGKKKLQDISKSLEYNYLQNLGETKNYGIFNKNRETDDSLLNKRMEETSATYAKLNGTTGGLDDLHRKAGDFFRRINDPSTEIGKSVLGPPDPEDETYRPISPVKAADAYNKFINELVNPKVVNNGNSSIFADGSPVLDENKANPYKRDPDLPSRDLSKMFAKTNIDTIIPKYDSSNDRKSREQLEFDFTKSYIKPDGSVNLKKVGEWINGEKGLTDEQLGIDSYREVASSGFSGDFGQGFSREYKTKDELNKERDSKIRELVKNPKQLIELFKRYGR